jgi:hypothetical protein
MEMLMKQDDAQKGFGTVIKRLKPLRITETGEIRLTIIEREGKRSLDIRYFVRTKRYTGYTTKGNTLSLEEVKLFKSQLKKIIKLLTP